MRRPGRQFMFRLAGYLGKTVRQLGEEITSDELTEWQAWWNIQPFGEDINSWRTGTIAAVVANAHSKRGKYTAQHFMPKMRRLVKQSQATIKRNLLAWAVILNGPKKNSEEGAKSDGE